MKLMKLELRRLESSHREVVYIWAWTDALQNLRLILSILICDRFAFVFSRSWLALKGNYQSSLRKKEINWKKY